MDSPFSRAYAFNGRDVDTATFGLDVRNFVLVSQPKPAILDRYDHWRNRNLQQSVLTQFGDRTISNSEGYREIKLTGFSVERLGYALEYLFQKEAVAVDYLRRRYYSHSLLRAMGSITTIMGDVVTAEDGLTHLTTEAFESIVGPAVHRIADHAGLLALRLNVARNDSAAEDLVVVIENGRLAGGQAALWLGQD